MRVGRERADPAELLCRGPCAACCIAYRETLIARVNRGSGTSMNTKTKTVLLATMIVTLAALPLLKSPPNFEQCSKQAARSVTTSKMLATLVSRCESKFAGRRKPGGGYTYLHPFMRQQFDIKGPNPTKEEMEHIARAFDAYIERKKEAEAARLAREAAIREEQAKQRMKDREHVAAAAVKMTIVGVKFGSSEFDASVEVNNESKETLSEISFDWALIPKGDKVCPVDARDATWSVKSVDLPPGGSVILNTHETTSASTSPSSLRLCGKVSEVRIADKTASAQ